MSTARGLEFFDPRTLVDPYPFYEAHRAQGPVLDVSTDGRATYLVIGADAIREVVASPAVFSSRPVGAQGINVYPRAEAYLKEKGFGRTPHLIVMDPPRHTAFRGVLGRVLRDKRVHHMRPQIRSVGEHLVDGFVDRGECEFVREFAWSLSALVIADLLGVDRDRLDDFKRWSDAWVLPLLQPLTEHQMIACLEQVAELQRYLVGELDARRSAPRDDLLSDIAHATFDLGQGEVPLRLHEQLGMCEVLIVAGNDTTANALSRCPEQLSHGDARDRTRRRPDRGRLAGTAGLGRSEPGPGGMGAPGHVRRRADVSPVPPCLWQRHPFLRRCGARAAGTRRVLFGSRASPARTAAAAGLDTPGCPSQGRARHAQPRAIADPVRPTGMIDHLPARQQSNNAIDPFGASQ
jgi:cytochrome P450